MKHSLCFENLLVHYDPNKPLVLACDASPYGLGAVLSHVLPDETEKTCFLHISHFDIC